jgi:hypothetical protein
MSLRLGCFVSLCDRALDFETIAPVRLAQLAGEHSAARTFEADGGEIIALQGQKSANLKIGDVAEIHWYFLQNRGHWQPRLLNAGLHESRPTPIRRHGLRLGIVREFIAERQEKRLRQQEEALTGAPVHAERKPRRRRLAIPAPKCKRVP